MKGMNAWERATLDYLLSDKCHRLDGEMNTQKILRSWYERPALCFSLGILLCMPEKSRKASFFRLPCTCPHGMSFQLLNVQNQPIHGQRKE